MGKNIQNSFQANRWDNYEEKVTIMMNCVGEMSSSSCSAYKSAAAGHWQQVVTELYHDMPQETRNNIDQLQQDWNCCCNTTETSNTFKMDTMCAWLKPDTGGKTCPQGLDNIKLRDAG